MILRAVRAARASRRLRTTSRRWSAGGAALACALAFALSVGWRVPPAAGSEQGSSRLAPLAEESGKPAKKEKAKEKAKARAEDTKEAVVAPRNIEVVGKLGSDVKGLEGFHNVTYFQKDAKGKRKQEKALLEITESTALRLDQPVRLEDLASGDSVYLFGKSVVREVQGKGGGGVGLGGNRGGKDRQIQAVRVLLAGKDLRVNDAFKDPKDTSFKWHKATISSSKSGLWVTYEGEEYRVTLDKGAPILRRGECDRKMVKPGLSMIFTGEKTDPPADADKKLVEGKTIFKASRIVAIDPRYVESAYGAIAP